MRNEALAQGIRLKAIIVEKDLLADEPYTTHLRWARRGYVDAYHTGFPCATFSQTEGQKGPKPSRSSSQQVAALRLEGQLTSRSAGLRQWHNYGMPCN